MNVKNIHDFVDYNSSGDGIITFDKEDNCYICKNNNDEIKFDLKGFLFKREFIRSYVVRQFRYKFISKKLKISKLFSLKLKTQYKKCNIWLIINGRKYLIFDSKGIIYNSFISAEISKSKFSPMYLNMRSYSRLNTVRVINEEIYLKSKKF